MTNKTYNKITESDSSQRNDTIIDGVEIGPALVVREHGSAAGDDKNGENARHANHLGLIDFGLFEAQALLH